MRVANLKEALKKRQTSKAYAAADTELAAILADEKSRKVLLEVASNNRPLNVLLDKLYDKFDAAKDARTKALIRHKIEVIMSNPPETKTELMMDAAYEAFLSGEAAEKVEVVKRHIKENVFNPVNLLEDAKEVLNAVRNGEAASEDLSMKAAYVITYGQLYGLGGVVSKKECDNHIRQLVKIQPMQVFFNSNSKKHSEGN